VYQQSKRALDKEGLSSTPSSEVHSDLLGHGGIICSPQQLEIAAEVGDQIHASDKTLSITLTYAIWKLSRDTDVQQRLRHECQALGSKFYTGSTAALPSASVINTLPLLHGVIMETLRMHSIVAGRQARVTQHGKLSKLEKHENIPGGYRVQSYAWFLPHNADVFLIPSLGTHRDSCNRQEK
jgi:cytochrome P450